MLNQFLVMTHNSFRIQGNCSSKPVGIRAKEAPCTSGTIETKRALVFVSHRNVCRVEHVFDEVLCPTPRGPRVLMRRQPTSCRVNYDILATGPKCATPSSKVSRYLADPCTSSAVGRTLHTVIISKHIRCTISFDKFQPLRMSNAPTCTTPKNEAQSCRLQDNPSP